VQLEEVVTILLSYRSGTTPVGIVNSIGLDDETVELANLNTLLDKNVHMRSLVIIGNSSSRSDNNWMLTPRGYLDNE